MVNVHVGSRRVLTEVLAALVPTVDGYVALGDCGDAPMGSVLSGVLRCGEDGFPAGTGSDALKLEPHAAFEKLADSLRSMLGQTRPLILRFEPPTPPCSPTSTAPPSPREPPPRWQKFADPASGEFWWHLTEADWFRVRSPGEWTEFEDPVSRRRWWWNGRTRSYFFA